MPYEILIDDTNFNLYIRGTRKEMESLELFLRSHKIKFSKKEEIYARNPYADSIAFMNTVKEVVLVIAPIVIPILYQKLSEAKTTKILNRIRRSIGEIYSAIPPKYKRRTRGINKKR